VPLEPAKPPQAAGAAKPAPANLVQNARVIAEAKPAAAAPKPAPVAPVRTPVTPASAVAKPAAPPAPAKPAAAPVAKPAAAPAPAATRPPVMPAAPKPVAPPPAQPAAPAKPRILFVDDDARILTALKTTFRHEYEVLTAESGDAALEMMKSGPLHVVVSDKRMPGVTGVELLRKARSLQPNTVRILLTGYTDLAALVGSINEGEIFRFVKKPWDNDELKKALADAVKIAMEMAATPTPKPVSPRSAGSILVIDRGEKIARGLERLVAGAAHVVQAASAAEAVKVLAKEEIALIVADMGAGMDGLVALFRELKAKRPEVLSILLTDQPDSELAIELINKAHIFRFLPKPVDGKELRSQVAAALRRYAAFKQIPTLGEPAASALAERAGTHDRAVARNA
jgi:DNA-binding NtrC family response regulator